MNMATSFTLKRAQPDLMISNNHAELRTDIISGTPINGNDTWLLQSGLRAVRATSCLAEPIAGDTVLVAVESESIFVISILKRTLDTPITVSPPSGVGLNLKTKFFSLISERNIDFSSLTGINLSAPLGTIRTISENLLQTVQGSIVNIAKTMISNADDVQVNAKGSILSKAKTHVITADQDLFMDADRINMG